MLKVIITLAIIDLLLKKYQIIPIINGIVIVPDDKLKFPKLHTYHPLETTTLLLNMNKPEPSRIIPRNKLIRTTCYVNKNER